MSELVPDVFTVDEVARATGVPSTVVRDAVARGELVCVRGTSFIQLPQPSTAAEQLRRAAVAGVRPHERELLAHHEVSRRDLKPSAIASLAVHGLLTACVVWLSIDPVESVGVIPVAQEPSHLVFLQLPGPGGGGGGGGARQPKPAPQLTRRGDAAPAISTPRVREEPTVSATSEEAADTSSPEPVQRLETPAPAPAPPVAAPVQTVAADESDTEGVLGPQAQSPASRGPGSEGGIGSNRGTGNGVGVGSGIDDGQGGGTGGGPYRPGSGVEAPRLLREVKAEYTEDARRRNLTGEVLLEVIISKDGRVGSVRVLRGLGAGLDERAVYAVRQWLFSPARRQGQPVDVIVQVAVDFNLR